MIKNYEAILIEISKTNLEQNGYILTETKSGHYTLKISNFGDTFFLHSKYNPIKEGEAFAKQNISNFDKIVVYGLGLGYHIKPIISALMPGQKLEVFEYDINVIKAAFEHTDIVDWLNKDNVTFHYCGNKEEFAKNLAEAIIDCSHYALYKPSMRLVPFLEPAALKASAQFSHKAVSEGDTVLFYNGASQYGSLNAFEYYLSQSFIQLGLKVVNINISDDFYGIYTLFHIKNCRFILSFCLPGVLENPQELAIAFDTFKKCYVFMSVDDPVFHITRPNIPVKNSIFTWIDKNHVKLFDRFKEFYPNVQNKFLPHGGELDVGDSSVYTKRPIDVLFSGSITDYFNISKAFADVHISERPLISEIADYCNNNQDKTIEEAFEIVLTKSGSVTNEILYNSLKKNGRAVYRYLWSKRRYDAVKALLDAGIAITCFGTGWDDTEFIKYPNFHYKGIVNYNQQRLLFKEAKIVINIMCVKKDGSHERVFSAMLHGALCLTDYSKYLCEQFTDGKDIVFFDLEKPYLLPDITRQYLDNKALREEIAANGLAKAKSNHTWFERAKALLEFFD